MQNTIKYLEVINDKLTSNKDLLNGLDGAIGDGDFGTNITRGFNEIINSKHLFTKDTTLDADLTTCAKILMSKIAGSSGPIFATVFLRLAATFKNKTTITNQDMAAGFENVIDGIFAIGKTKVGEKTMLDAVHPTIEVFKNSHSDKINFKDAYLAAKKGAEATKNMVATKGRASYLAERSLGHMDAGSCAISLAFEALSELK